MRSIIDFLKRKKTKKVTSRLFSVFLVLVIIFLLVPLLPIENNYSLKIVLSGSMEPTIKMGSLAVVRPVENYETGDVITFQTGSNTPTTHRIYDTTVVNGDLAYTTKGDANNTPDPNNVLEKDIVGRVFFSIPYAGYVIDFVSSPLGFALLIGLPAILIIAGEVKKIYKEVKTTDEK